MIALLRSNPKPKAPYPARPPPIALNARLRMKRQTAQDRYGSAIYGILLKWYISCTRETDNRHLTRLCYRNFPVLRKCGNRFRIRDSYKPSGQHAKAGNLIGHVHLTQRQLQLLVEIDGTRISYPGLQRQLRDQHSDTLILNLDHCAKPFPFMFLIKIQ